VYDPIGIEKETEQFEKEGGNRRDSFLGKVFLWRTGKRESSHKEKLQTDANPKV